MSPEFEKVLARLHERMEREKAQRAGMSREEVDARIEEFMLPIGPEAGRFLNLLIKAAGARTCLEVGASVGYSTLWLAEAARATGGRVISLEVSPAKHAEARENLAEAGLADSVEWITGDALETIAAQPGPFDFVLLDLWKNLYIPCFDALRPKLAAGALVTADNMVTPADNESTRAYQTHVRAVPGLESVMVPIGNGIELSRAPG